MRRILLILITAVTLGLGMQPLNATPGATPLFGGGEPSSLVSASELQISVSKGDIIIESATAITGITIYDITGKVLYSAKFAPTSHIRLDRTRFPLSPALLLVQVTFDGGSTSVTKLKI